MDKLNNRLRDHGSWLYGVEKPRVDINTIFNPSLKTIPTAQKMLIVKELLFCGVDITLLESSLESSSSLDQLALQEILKASSEPEFSSLDIHYPLNWFRGHEAGFFYDQDSHSSREGGPSYIMIIHGLEVMTPQLFERLIGTSDTLLRKRMIYLEYSLTRPDTRIFPNSEQVMTVVEDRLLEQIDSYPPETRAGYGVVTLLAEDIHDELDEKHRLNKIKHANQLFAAIESQNMEALEALRSFFMSGRFVPEGQQEAPSKEWYYERVWDIALQRELAKLRGVELVLKPLVRQDGK